jgi:hypothetical protein
MTFRYLMDENLAPFYKVISSNESSIIKLHKIDMHGAYT